MHCLELSGNRLDFEYLNTLPIGHVVNTTMGAKPEIMCVILMRTVLPKICCVKWVILRLQDRIDQTPFCAETPPLYENLRMPFPNSDVSMK